MDIRFRSLVSIVTVLVSCAGYEIAVVSLAQVLCDSNDVHEADQDVRCDTVGIKDGGKTMVPCI